MDWKWTYHETPAVDTPRLTVYDIEELVSSGENDFRRTNLMGLDLEQFSFGRINFTKACFIGATLSGVSMRETNFTDADMRNVNLTEANLVEVNLTEASLEGANLRGAKLYRCNLSGTTLRNVNLTFADLRETKNLNLRSNSNGMWRTNILLCQTILPDGTFVPGPFLTTGRGIDSIENLNKFT